MNDVVNSKSPLLLLISLVNRKTKKKIQTNKLEQLTKKKSHTERIEQNQQQHPSLPYYHLHIILLKYLTYTIN